MKKALQKIIPFVLCFCMLFLFACKDTSTPPPANGDNNGGNEQTPPDDNNPDEDKDPDEEKPPVDKTQTYTISAKDKQGAAIANVWFEAYYYGDYEAKSDLTVVQKASTDASGIATLKFEPEDGTSYMARLASAGEKATDPALDYRYTLDNKADGTSLTFDSERKATAVFNYYPNKFPFSLTTEHSYKRVATEDSFTESGDDLTLNIEANIINYFCFAPYIAPKINGDGMTEAEFNKAIDEATDAARQAASGKYDVTFTTDSNANITMERYNGNRGNTPINAEGVPTQILAITGNAPDNAEDAELYTGNDTVSLELTKDYSASDYLFGVKADKDCTVTISVTRTGDATEETTVTITPVAPSGNPIEWTDAKVAENKNDGENLLEIPFDGTENVVLGTDGYYRVGDENGALLYVVLTKETRGGTTPISELKTDPNNPRAETIFQFQSKTDPSKKFDYSIFVNGEMDEKNENKVTYGYADLATNSYGIYPVNEEIRTFLEYCGFFMCAEPGAQNWLIPCKYFGSDAITETGTILATGMRKISLTEEEAFNGKLYTVKSQSGGTFTLRATDDKVLVWTNDVFNPIIGEKENNGESAFVGSYSFELKAGESFSFYCGYAWTEATEYSLTLLKTSGEPEPYIGLGLNSVNITETYSAQSFFFTPEKSGWYRVSVSENDVNGIQDISYDNNPIIDLFSEPDENGNFVGFAIYLEANVEIEITLTASAIGDYLFTLEETEEPKFVTGENMISGLTQNSPLTRKFGGETGTYSITIQARPGFSSTMTVTIGEQAYTLNAENNYTVNAEISADAEITVSTDNSNNNPFFGDEFMLMFELAA